MENIKRVTKVTRNEDDIRIQEELEAKKQKEKMPKKIGDRIQWAKE